MEYQQGGETIHDRARLVDWKDARNEWLAVNQMTEVAELQTLLDRQAGGVIFATIQKFLSEDGDFDVITARRNVVVFVDEVTEGMEDSERARFAGKWSTLGALVGASERLDELAALIVDYF